MARVQLHHFIDMAPKADTAVRHAALDRRGFLTAAAGLAAGDGHGAGGLRPQFRPAPSRCAIPIPTSSCSTSGSSTSSATRRSSGCYTGTLWAEGPAWNGVGRYLLWSDIPNDVQLRWLEEDGHVSAFRNPAGNSNGNTFDFEGRQIACEHGTRRVVRYEHNGKITVLADKFDGQAAQRAQRRRGPSRRRRIWFTDPGYGSLMNYEGNGCRRGRARCSPSKEAIYRIDKTGKIDQGDRRDVQAERPLLLARLQEALRRRHRRLALRKPKNII